MLAVSTGELGSDIIPEALLEKVSKAASSENITVSQFITRALQREIKTGILNNQQKD